MPVLIAIVAVVVSACERGGSSWTVETRTIRGSGVLVEEDRPVAGFSEVAFETFGELRIVQDARETLRIRAEDNLLPYLVTEVQSGLLVMRTQSGVDLEATRPIEFHLTAVDLNRLVFRGVGDIELPDLTVDHLSLAASGVGGIHCSGLDAVTLDVSLSGIGNVSASGRVEEQVAKLSQFGDYDAGDLVCGRAIVRIDGTGSAMVRVSERLVVTLNGSGSVYYVGDPVVEIHGSGSGRVVKVG